MARSAREGGGGGGCDIARIVSSLRYSYKVRNDGFYPSSSPCSGLVAMREVQLFQCKVKGVKSVLGYIKRDDGSTDFWRI
jgi:hypothetical protein